MTPAEEKDVRPELQRVQAWLNNKSVLIYPDDVAFLLSALQSAEQERDKLQGLNNLLSEKLERRTLEYDKLAAEVERLKADAWGPAIVRSSIALRERAEAAEAKLSLLERKTTNGDTP